MSVMNLVKGHVFATGRRRRRTIYGLNSAGTLAGARKTPLDLSIAKAQDGPGVFEVK
jgi:hypothetical protein